MTLRAQRMCSLDRRLEEITAPLGSPLDDQPLRVIVDLVREVGGREKASEIFNRGHGIGEGLVDLL